MKVFRNVFSLLMALLLTFSLMVPAFADGEETRAVAAQSSGASTVKITSTVGLTLVTDNSPSKNVIEKASHSYIAVKLLDLYGVYDADGRTPAVDSNGNPVYQYQAAFDAPTVFGISPEANNVANPLEPGNSSSAYWMLDLDTGAITLQDGTTLIEDMFAQNENSSNAAKLAAALAQYVSSGSNSSNFITETLSIDTTTELECGYWLIYETGNSSSDKTVATKPLLIDLRPELEDGLAVSLKDATVSITHVITNDDRYSDKQDNRAITDTVSYETTTNFPVYEANTVNSFTDATFVIFEEVDTSLDIDTDSIVVTVNGSQVASSDFSIEYDRGVHNFEITFPQSYVMAHQGQDISVVYDATLNATADFNQLGKNKSTATVTYHNNPELKNSTKQLTDSVEVVTYAIDLRKLDGAHTSLLPGVKFEMKLGDELLYFVVNEDGQYVRALSTAEGATSDIITVDSGDITFVGLDEGSYSIHEKETPQGYALLAKDVSLNISKVEVGEADVTLDGAMVAHVNRASLITDADGDTEEYVKTSSNAGLSDVNIIIRNYKGVTLPTTGSASAIAISFAGIVIALVGIAFVSSRRKED